MKNKGFFLPKVVRFLVETLAELKGDPYEDKKKYLSQERRMLGIQDI